MSDASFTSQRIPATSVVGAGARGAVVVVDGVVIGLRGLLLIVSTLGEDHQEA